MDDTVRWRPIPDSNYYVSETGLVQHVNSERPLKAARLPNGYLSVAFWQCRKLRRYTVHSLVANAFLGDRPPGMEVRHMDGSRTNNAIWNLAYGTKVENAADRERHGRTCRGQGNGNAKASDNEAEFIRLIYAAKGANQYQLAALFGISQAQVNNIVLNKQRLLRSGEIAVPAGEPLSRRETAA